MFWPVFMVFEVLPPFCEPRFPQTGSKPALTSCVPRGFRKIKVFMHFDQVKMSENARSPESPGIPRNPPESEVKMSKKLQFIEILWNSFEFFGILLNPLESRRISLNPLESAKILQNPGESLNLSDSIRNNMSCTKLLDGWSWRACRSELEQCQPSEGLQS